MRLRIWPGVPLLAGSLAVAAAPLTPAEIAERCSNADDRAQCARRVEELQLQRLPGLAQRNGDELRITLFPSGNIVLRDSVSLRGRKPMRCGTISTASTPYCFSRPTASAAVFCWCSEPTGGNMRCRPIQCLRPIAGIW